MRRLVVLVPALGILALGYAPPAAAQAGPGRSADAAADAVASAVELRNRGDFGAAAALLERHLEDRPGDVRARFLLAETRYWQGAFDAARTGFERVLELEPGHPEARRQLGEILAASAPWVHVASSAERDDQPRESVSLTAQAGWYPTPLRTVAVRARVRGLEAGGRPGAGAAGAVTIARVDASIKQAWPLVRLDAEAGAGWLHRSTGQGDDWTGRLGLGVRLGGRFVLRAEAERAPYLWTAASVATPVTTESVTALLERTPGSGWIGRAAHTVQRFPDGNLVHAGYAWFLAPLVAAAAGNVQLGYAFAYEDARDSRYLPRDPVEPPPGGSGEVAGRYEPYHTPEGGRSHSVVAAVDVAGNRLLSLDAGGSYAVHAVERAPFLHAVTDTLAMQVIVTRDFYRRRYHPWTARAAVTVLPRSAFAVRIQAEHMRTAYYRLTTITAGTTHRFIGRALRGLER